MSALTAMLNMIMQRPISWLRVYTFLLGALFILYLFLVPIRPYDTDLWYHLNGGRFFWQTGILQDFPFFSVFADSKKWTNYFWAFQALVYPVYDAFGYWGLWGLRGLLASLVVAMVLLFSHRSMRSSVDGSVRGVLTLIAVAAIILILPRLEFLRPHLFSYLFILCSIYILEFRKDLLWLLPFLALLWVNLHGVEWVVFALICGGYFLGHLSKHLGLMRGEADFRPWQLVAIGLSFLAILVNPYVLEILRAPFSFPVDIDLIINELKPVSIIFSAQDGFVPSVCVLVNSAIFIYACYVSIVERSFDPGRFVIAIGGWFLFTKGMRFLSEWALLTMPFIFHVLKMHVPVHVCRRRAYFVLGMLGIVILPSIALGGKLITEIKSPRPFDAMILPVGAMDFLEQIEGPINVLSDPSIGGYVQWRLGDRGKIWMDMEFPPFDAFDYYRFRAAKRDTNSFVKLAEENVVDFVLFSDVKGDFRELANKVGYLKLVFFDNSYSLYVNENRQRLVASNYTIQYIDIADIYDVTHNPIDKKRELDRLVPYMNNSVSMLYLYGSLMLPSDPDSEPLKGIVERLFELSPQDAKPYFLKAQGYERTGNCELAIPYFEQAVLRADSAKNKRSMELKLAFCHFLKSDHQAAYDLYKRILNPYLRQEEPEELYRAAVSAFRSREIERGYLWLKMAKHQVEGDTERAALYAQIRRLENSLGEVGSEEQR